MKPAERRERRLRIFEILLAILAIAISIFALIISISQTDTSNRIAQQALESAKQANDIALGRTQEYPAIEIVETDNPKTTLTSIAAVQAAEFSLFIKNTGQTPISGVHLLLVGVSGFTYLLENPTQDYKGDLGRMRVPVDFEEQLLPNGYAYIDVSQPVLKYLQSIKAEFKSPNAEHRTIINVVVLARRAGEELPVQIPMRGQPTSDRKLISVDYVPEVVRSKELDTYLESKKPFYRIVPPTE